MSLAPQLDRYLSVRRSLGYDLRTEERILRRFIRFADQEGATHTDTALFLRWDASLPEVSGGTRAPPDIHELLASDTVRLGPGAGAEPSGPAAPRGPQPLGSPVPPP